MTDTSVTGLIRDNDEVSYRSQVADIVSWCTSNNLILNVAKTKEIIVDFSRF